MGTYGNLWKLHGMFLEVAWCFFTVNLSAARRFSLRVFELIGRSSCTCVFHDASRFFTVCFRCQVVVTLHVFAVSSFLHCVFSMSSRFTLCVFAVDHVYIASFRCKTFFLCLFHDASRFLFVVCFALQVVFRCVFYTAGRFRIVCF